MISFTFPLQFFNGSIGVVSQDDDRFFAQLLAVTMQTLPGELPLRPEYGVKSPLFDAEQTAKFAQLAAQFIPEIRVLDIVSGPADDGFVAISVDFERVGS